MPPHRLAAIALSCGVFIFSVQDAIVKGLSGGYPVAEAVVIRSLTALPVMIWLVRRRREPARVQGSRRPLLGRGLILFGAFTCYYLALPAMPLASVAALWFTGPLFLVALAGPLTGERGDWRAWAVVSLGFGGVMIMLRPSGGLLHPAAVLPIVAAATYAIAQLMARRMRAGATASVMALYQNSVYLAGALTLGFVLAPFARATEGGGSLDFLLRAWQWPTPRDAALFAICGPIAAVGSTLLSHAYRIAGAATVAPFEYSALLWATIWGVMFWGEVPSGGAVLGAALIVGSGLLAIRRVT